MSGRSAARSAAVPARATTARRADAVRAPRTEPRATSRATPVRPELRLVPGLTPRARRRRLVSPGSRAPFVLLVVALLVGTTLGLLILNTVIAVDSLKATSLRAENAERAQEVQRLEQQVTTAGTPAEIARAAEAAGLVPAGDAAYLVLDPDGGAVLAPHDDETAESVLLPGALHLADDLDGVGGGARLARADVAHHLRVTDLGGDRRRVLADRPAEQETVGLEHDAPNLAARLCGTQDDLDRGTPPGRRAEREDALDRRGPRAHVP